MLVTALPTHISRAAVTPARPAARCCSRVLAQAVPKGRENRGYPGYAAAKPLLVRIPGLQQFAAAIWERRRRIPSQIYNDPLDHIFNEFDADGDGHLTAEEVATALQARNVNASAAQVQEFINAIDENKNGMVEREEFADFIFAMAAADLKSTSFSSIDAAKP